MRSIGASARGSGSRRRIACERALGTSRGDGWLLPETRQPCPAGHLTAADRAQIRLKETGIAALSERSASGSEGLAILLFEQAHLCSVAWKRAWGACRWWAFDHEICLRRHDLGDLDVERLRNEAVQGAPSVRTVVRRRGGWNTRWLTCRRERKLADQQGSRLGRARQSPCWHFAEIISQALTRRLE